MFDTKVLYSSDDHITTNILIFDYLYKMYRGILGPVEIYDQYQYNILKLEDMFSTKLVDPSMWRCAISLKNMIEKNRSDESVRDFLSSISSIPVSGHMFRRETTTTDRLNGIAPQLILCAGLPWDKTTMQWDSYDILFQLEFPIDSYELIHIGEARYLYIPIMEYVWHTGDFRISYIMDDMFTEEWNVNIALVWDRYSYSAKFIHPAQHDFPDYRTQQWSEFVDMYKRD